MRKCPKCGGETFKALIRRGALVQINDDLTVEILKESVNNFELVKGDMICADKACNHVSLYEDLTAKTPCVSCGELHEDHELEDGKCELCLIKEKFGRSTKEDLFKLILELQRKAGPQQQKNEKKLEQAEEVEKKLEEKEAEVKETVAEEPEKEEVKPAPKKKRSHKKKPVETAEETEEDSEEEETDTEETVKVPDEALVPEDAGTDVKTVTPEVVQEKEMTPERAEAKDVSTKPQAEAVNGLEDIFGSTPEPVLADEESEEEELEVPVDFTF